MPDQPWPGSDAESPAPPSVKAAEFPATIRQQRLTGERALFQAHDLRIAGCAFGDGESPLKETHDLQVSNTLFEWKYPLWHSQRIDLQHCVLLGTARAGIWYSEDVTMTDSTIAAPSPSAAPRG